MALQVALSGLGIAGAFIFTAWSPLAHKAEVFGFTRSASSFVNIHGSDPTTFYQIPNSLQCEDLHHHVPSNLLFAACQTSERLDRLKWFPGMAWLSDPSYARGGSLAVIEPGTHKITHLTLENFDIPFVTHGFDVITSPSNPEEVYIFAINHLPNPDYTSGSSQPKARSQVELFKHTLHSQTAQHLRSIRHESIRTPNDIAAVSPSEFFVTNDHYYREGFGRAAEDILGQHFAAWTETMHISLEPAVTVADPTADEKALSGITASVALSPIHNNNGLGHASASRPDQILIVDATDGVLLRARRNGSTQLTGIEPIFLDHTIDNPSWFEDRWATPTNNASGYVLAGLARAHAMEAAVLKDLPVETIVTHIRPVAGNASSPAEPRHALWDKKILFQDDGKKIRCVATAVLVGIDPKSEGGKKKAWLYITGFMSDHVVAVKVDL